MEGSSPKKWFWQEIPANPPPSIYCGVCRGPYSLGCERHAFRAYGCVICGSSFSNGCLECSGGFRHVHEAKRLLKVAEHEETFWTLLLIRQRLYPSLPRALIGRICNMTWYIAGPSLHRLPCPLFVLDCGHTYHNHCIERWYFKRGVCPIDNSALSGLRPDQVLLQAVWRKSYLQLVRVP